MDGSDATAGALPSAAPLSSVRTLAERVDGRHGSAAAGDRHGVFVADVTADCAVVSSILSHGVGAHVTTVLVDRFTWSYFLHADNADVVQLLARLGRQLLRTTEASPVTLPVLDRLLSSLIFPTVNARVWAALRTGDSPDVGTSSRVDALPMVTRGPTQVAAVRPPPAEAVPFSQASSAMVVHASGAVVAPSQASDALRPVADHAPVAVVDITLVALVCDILLLILEAGQSVALHRFSAPSWLFLRCALARGRWPPQAGAMLRAACQRDVSVVSKAATTFAEVNAHARARGEDPPTIYQDGLGHLRELHTTMWFGFAQTLDQADAACASSFACDLDTVSLFTTLPGVLALIPPSYAPTGSALWLWCRTLCDVTARILDAVNATAQSVLGSGTLFQGSDADYAAERRELVMRDALGWLLSPPPPPEDASSLPSTAVSLIKTEIGLVSGGGRAAGHDWRSGSGACVITLARLLSTGPRLLMPHAVAVVSLSALKLLDVATSQYALHPGDRTPLALFWACAAFADTSRTCGASASARREDGDGVGGGGGGPKMRAQDDLRATVQELRDVGDVAWSVPAIENVLKAVLMRCVRALATSRRIAHGSWAEHKYKADVGGTFFDALPWLWAAAHGAAGGIPDSTEMMLWRVVGNIFSPRLR